MKAFWWVTAIALLAAEISVLVFAIYQMWLMFHHLNDDSSWSNLVCMVLSLLTVAVLSEFYHASLRQIVKESTGD